MLVHNLVQVQSVLLELRYKELGMELVEADPDADYQGEIDVESRFIIGVDNERG